MSEISGAFLQPTPSLTHSHTITSFLTPEAWCRIYRSCGITFFTLCNHCRLNLATIPNLWSQAFLLPSPLRTLLTHSLSLKAILHGLYFGAEFVLLRIVALFQMRLFDFFLQKILRSFLQKICETFLQKLYSFSLLNAKLLILFHQIILKLFPLNILTTNLYKADYLCIPKI